MKKIVLVLFLCACLDNGLAQSWNFKWCTQPYIDLSALSFPTTETGYVLGNWVYPYLSPSNGVIFKTTDGGGTFTQLYGTEPPPVKAVLYDIHFIDASIGHAVGDSGLIISTTNGGATWTKEVSGTQSSLAKILFIDSSIGFILGSPGTFLTTSDGGTTWTPISLGTDIVYGDIIFLSPTVGLITTSSGIFKTTDAGSNWSLLTDNIVSILSFPTASVGYGSCSSGGGIQHYLAKTVDGGLHWTGIESTLVPADTWYRGLVFLDENTGYVIRSNQDGGDVLVTQDGGLNWSVTQHFNMNLNAMCFPSANIGYLVFEDSFYKTTDGGGIITDAEYTGFNSLSIYPNPAGSSLIIKNIDPLCTELRLYNTLAQCILVSPVNNQKEVIFDISSLTDGIYLLNICTEKSSIVKKVVIQH